MFTVAVEFATYGASCDDGRHVVDAAVVGCDVLFVGGLVGHVGRWREGIVGLHFLKGLATLRKGRWYRRPLLMKPDATHKVRIVRIFRIVKEVVAYTSTKINWWKISYFCLRYSRLQELV